MPIAALPLLKSAVGCTPRAPEIMNTLDRLVGNSGAGGYGNREDTLLSSNSWDDDAKYADCPPLVLKRPDGSMFNFPGASALVAGAVNPDQLLGGGPVAPQGGDAAKAGAVSAIANPLNAAQLSNQVHLAGITLVRRYYDGWLRSDEARAPRKEL